jgi:hypothetical protein
MTRSWPVVVEFVVTGSRLARYYAPAKIEESRF